MLRVLTFSTLYPNSVRPTYGIFVETRLRHLLQTGEVEARVVAPVPWFPLTHSMFGDYARQAQVPRHETLRGILVAHPRYLVVPKVGMSSTPFTLAASARRAIEAFRREGFDFDLIDAHYYYPDGVAAALLAKQFGKPYVITARGTDINLIPDYRVPRRLIQWAGQRAACSITVSAALQEKLVALGIPRDRTRVLRNGVDLERFTPMDRALARRELGLPDALTFVCVGHLVELKGHRLVIEALAQRFPEAQLLIAGEGELRSQLASLATSLGVSDRVRFVGVVPQENLKTYLSAADALVLASSREGWPNVLLESMACGTPVVATRLPGTSEIVTASEAGVLASERSASGLADAMRALMAAYPSRDATRAFAQRYSWDETTRGQLELFRYIVDDNKR